MFIEITLCILSALLLGLSFSFSSLWVLAWFAFIPLFLALENKTAKSAFILSYFTGVLFWAGAIYWLAHVTLLGQTLLILYLALYFGIFGLIVSRPCIRFPLLFVPALWVALEYLRGHLFTGFPWALLGYSQYANLAFIQVADIGGVWMVSFLVMMVNVVIYQILGARFWVLGSRMSSTRVKIKYLWLPALLLIFTLIYGYYRLSPAPLPVRLAGNTQHLTPIKVSVIQGNIPQELKWEMASRDFIMEKYFDLTKQARSDDADLIIWPEASFPVVPEEEPLYYERLSLFIKKTGKPFLFGAVTNRNGFYYNSALMISGDGVLLDRYDKLHLVPFGEYIPFRSVFRSLETIVPIGDITRGRYYTLFKIDNHKTEIKSQFGVLICFEDVFPELARSFVNRGADFLVNITNDAWFGKSTEAYQHLAASVFRAVENRVNLVRSANTGISGFISPQGRVYALAAEGGNLTFVPGYKSQVILIHRQRSFYAGHADALVIFCFFYILYIAIFRLFSALKYAGKRKNHV